MSEVLKVRNLSKNYKNFQLDNVGFTVESNSITGFIGINGAGKSTTIKLILGLIKSLNTNIEFFGLPFHGNEKSIKDKIGIVMDNDYFYENLTLNEMKSIISPAYSNWDEKIFQFYLDKFNLKPKQKIETLSKGMKMKYSLALALSHNAELLIMDEPTSGLDPLVRDELMNILLDYKKIKNNSVFFSTHIISDLQKVADKIVLINNGKIIFEEELEELVNKYVIISGNSDQLYEQDKSKFLYYNKKENMFKGIAQSNIQLNNINQLDIKQAAIEDIMLFYIKESSLC